MISNHWFSRTLNFPHRRIGFLGVERHHLDAKVPRSKRSSSKAGDLDFCFRLVRPLAGPNWLIVAFILA